MPKKSFIIEPFLPLNISVIWHLNHLFWKHFSLWEETYDEHYEASLPSGVSESHKHDFVLKSTNRFIVLLNNLLKAEKLPKKIYVLEQGPGSGLYAKFFLDYIKVYSKQNNKPFYSRIQYLLSDTSEEILAASLANLSTHSPHVSCATDDKLTNFEGKVLFIRHSNLWDQLPAKIFSSSTDGNLNEMEVQPVLDCAIETELKPFGPNFTIDKVTQALKTRTIEELIIEQPLIWKPLVRALYLKIRYTPTTQKNLETTLDKKILHRLSLLHNGQEFVFNIGALRNIDKLSQLTEWQRGGYIEIVDIVIPSVTDFKSGRRPKKYDGSLAMPINGPMLKVYCERKNKHVTYEQIRGLNHIVTIRDYSLNALLKGGHFITIAEIAASKNQKISKIIHNTENLLWNNADIVAFSDQALVKSEYFKLSELVGLKLFKHLAKGSTLPILKTRTKTKSEVVTIAKNLKAQNVKNIFIVTGDPSGEDVETTQTSLDVLSELSTDFLCGAVAHPSPSDIPKTLLKIKAGARFLIMQATYNQAEWKEWVKAIKEHEIYLKVPILAVVMPIVSPRTLDVIQQIKDVSVPAEFVNQFKGLSDEQVRIKGLNVAKKMITDYKKSGIFSGIYIYSKSSEMTIKLANYIRSIG